MNPLNPYNNLGLNSNKFGKTQRDKYRKNKGLNGANKDYERASMARPSRKGQSSPPPDSMLPDSRTTSHITPLPEMVNSTSQCNVSIKFSDDSTVKASSSGVRNLHWMAYSGPCKVKLSDTLVAEDVTLRVLPVPESARKNIATLCMLDKAFSFDIDYRNKILGQASRDNDGLYYIPDRQDSMSETPSPFESKGISTMRAFIENFASEEVYESNSNETKHEALSAKSESGATKFVRRRTRLRRDVMTGTRVRNGCAPS